MARHTWGSGHFSFPMWSPEGYGTSHLGLWSFRFPGVVPRRLWHVTPGALVFQVMVNTWDSLCRFQGTFVDRTTWICLLPLRSKLSQLWLNSSFARFNSSSATFIMKSKCLYIAFKDLKNLPSLWPSTLLSLSMSFLNSLTKHSSLQLSPTECLPPHFLGCPFLCFQLKKLSYFQV